MELEKTEPVPLHVFSFEQSDGTVSQLDFSAPGEMGDFAFYQLAPDGTRQYFYSYHTNTSQIFEHFIACMASQPDAEQQFERLIKCLDGFDKSGLEQTDTGQTKFLGYQLDKIRTTVERGDQPTGRPSGDLALEPNQNYTTCIRTDNDTRVEVPHHQAWQFVSGIVWRSYGQNGEEYTDNSRHSTKTFKDALTATAEGLSARNQA